MKMMVAAAPPPESTLKKAADAGIALTHVYGLTETYGECPARPRLATPCPALPCPALPEIYSITCHNARSIMYTL